MRITLWACIAFMILISCESQKQYHLNEEIMASLGSKYKKAFSIGLPDLKEQIEADSTNILAHLTLAETKILLYIFGYSSRDETLPEAKTAYNTAKRLDPMNPGVIRLKAVLNFLDWKWDDAEPDFIEAISADPGNMNTRHWYSLYLAAMGRLDEALEHHDTIASMDQSQDYLVGRGSIFYFARMNEELARLMHEAIAKDTMAPWPYDWLGMAYCELNDFDNSIKTYFRAFELSDGTVEVGAGLGHALGLAGEYEPGKQMADYYALVAKDQYVPPVQRAYIHIGLGEHDEAIELLEQAYKEKSWFIAFMKVEPWLDPVRNDERVQAIMEKMKFPD